MQAPVWNAIGECAPGAGAIATVIDTMKSAPMPTGSQMFIADTGDVLGSVSGGCVEAAVIAEVEGVLGTGQPVTRRYGVSAHEAFAAGLTCGGTIAVLIHPVTESMRSVCQRLLLDTAEHRAVVWGVQSEGEDAGAAFCVDDAEWICGVTGAELSATLRVDAEALLRSRGTMLRRYGSAGERMAEDNTFFLCAGGSPVHLVLFGAVDFSAALCSAARLLGWRSTVVDARAAFATASRFPDADAVIVDWPDRWLRQEVSAGRVGRETAVCVLTHDPRFDVPAVMAALDTGCGYVGAMGFRRTHADRLQRLRAAGAEEHRLAELRSPLGLDLGGRTPAETAVSILAEIIAVRAAASGQPLRDSSGPIHAQLERV